MPYGASGNADKMEYITVRMQNSDTAIWNKRAPQEVHNMKPRSMQTMEVSVQNVAESFRIWFIETAQLHGTETEEEVRWDSTRRYVTQKYVVSPPIVRCYRSTVISFPS